MQLFKSGGVLPLKESPPVRPVLQHGRGSASFHNRDSAHDRITPFPLLAVPVNIDDAKAGVRADASVFPR